MVKMNNIIFLVVFLIVCLMVYLHYKKSYFNNDTLQTKLIKHLYTDVFQKRFVKNSNNQTLNDVDMVYVSTMPQRK